MHGWIHTRYALKDAVGIFQQFEYQRRTEIKQED